MNLSARQKRLLQWVGLPFLAIFTYVLVLHITFPYNRLKGKIAELMSDKYIVTINKARPTFLPGGLVLETVILETKPTRPGDEVTKVVIDRVEVDVGLFAMMGGRYDVDIVAEIASGKISGNLTVEKSGTKARFKATALPLAKIPGIRSAVGLPLGGELHASLKLDLPKGKWRKADGSITLECPGCTAGDGKTRIKPKLNSRSRRAERAAMFMGEGVIVPKLDLGNFSGELEIKEGRAEIKKLGGKSRHGEIEIEGAIQFMDPFKSSSWERRGCGRFRITEALKRKEPKFADMVALMGTGLQDDGYRHLVLRGKLSQTRWLASRRKCTLQTPRRGRPSRPQVTTRPPSQRIPPGIPTAPPGAPALARPAITDAGAAGAEAAKPPVPAKLPAPAGEKLQPNPAAARRKGPDDVQANPRKLGDGRSDSAQPVDEPENPQDPQDGDSDQSEGQAGQPEPEPAPQVE